MADLDVLDSATGARDNIKGTNSNLNVRQVAGTGQLPHNRYVICTLATDLKECQWNAGNVITELHVTNEGPGAIGFVIDDASNAALGTTGDFTEDLLVDRNFYFLLPNTSKTISLSAPLSYAGNVGKLGNMWIRADTNATKVHVAAS
jgi:hypothetical protein